MSGKVFPIKTETACRLKWSWSTLYLTDGTTSSCHRASHAQLTTDNFSNFHNLPNKIVDRQSMLNGKWPGNGCEYCRDIEKAGGFSDRQFQLTVPNVYPSELDIDQTITAVSPTVLEVFFQNTCNLKCVYCTEKYSSSIEKENLEYGKIDIGNRSILVENRYSELNPLFWEWLEHNFTKLQRLNILGGEPLLQSDCQKLIDFIDMNPNPLLELSVTTNLIIKEKRFNDCTDKLHKLLLDKKVGRIDIMASVDSWGVAQEYVRNGFDSEIFENNLIQLLKLPFRISLLSTVNALNIMEFPQLFEKLKQWRLHKDVYWYMHTVVPVDSHILRPDIFDYSIWGGVLDKLHDELPDSTYDDKITKNLLSGIMAKLKTSIHDVESQTKLKSYLTELDKRRGTNWKQTFSWLGTNDVAQ